MKQGIPGWIDCIECHGTGQMVISLSGDNPDSEEPEYGSCQECGGQGIVRCEHQEVIS